jgi:hypothetical protein
VECRERFRQAMRQVGASSEAHTIAALGREGERLTIDVAQLGDPDPERALIVLSGTHGVEGFAGSVQQVDFLERLAARAIPMPPPGTAVVLVHAVNPWGMSWWRRQNESNVDLNRNWRRSQTEPAANTGYDSIHDFLCPGGDELPSSESFLEPLQDVVAAEGADWVKAAISTGQYHRPDGLYFGGFRTEQSNLILEQVLAERLAGVGALLTIDCHTGHGSRGTYTLLSNVPTDSPEHRWLAARFDGDRIESSAPPKQCSIAPGLGAFLGAGGHHCLTLELGTRSDIPMILAERSEHWVHTNGRRDEHPEVIWNHRVCSIPDDAEWEGLGREHGRLVLDAAYATMLN